MPRCWRRSWGRRRGARRRLVAIEAGSYRATGHGVAAAGKGGSFGVVHGIVGHTELAEENGSVIYRVLVDGSDGTVGEVTVDAGTAEGRARQVLDGDPKD